MKRITWLIIAAVIIVGGYAYYSNQQAKEAARIEAAAQAAADAKAKEEAAAAAKAAEEAAAAKAAEAAAAADKAAKDAAAMMPPFGTDHDVGYAHLIWNALLDQKLAGPDAVAGTVYEGTQPHGFMLEMFIRSATIEGQKGDLIVKRNYGPEGVTADEVTANRKAHLGAVTVMFKREAGFDEETKNWFWTKFNADGSIATNPKGMALAGKVAKGMDQGCIACHSAADGGDFVFSDKY